MEYKRFGDTCVVRFDKGDMIADEILKIAKAEDIKVAHLSAIGATDDFEVGVFDMEKKAYNRVHFTGENFEICSLNGTLSTMNGEPYLHAHITAARGQAEVVGGHFFNGVISLTGEMIIRIIDGVVDRVHDDKLNINIYDFK